MAPPSVTTTASSSLSEREETNGRISHDSFDRFALQDEQWLVRLQKLGEQESELSRREENDTTASGNLAVTRTILHAARLANLQCASEAYRGQNNKQRSGCISNGWVEKHRLHTGKAEKQKRPDEVGMNTSSREG